MSNTIIFKKLDKYSKNPYKLCYQVKNGEIRQEQNNTSEYYIY